MHMYSMYLHTYIMLQESLRRYQMVRFYLQPQEDPHGSNVAVFVGNLPPKKSEYEYKDMLQKMLGANGKLYGDVFYWIIIILYDVLLSYSICISIAYH